MESQQNADAVNFAKQTLEAQAKEMQDRTGRRRAPSSPRRWWCHLTSGRNLRRYEIFSQLQMMHDSLLSNYWTSDAGQTYDAQASSDSVEKFENNLVYLAERILNLFSSHW